MTNSSPSSSNFAAPLLAWYDANGRILPWRKRWPTLADPYDVFLSELMLQQTVVATVIPYFEKFKSLWPTISDLASASEDAVLREWAGLGYYARARNMRKAAIEVATTHNGIFPDDEASLLSLPGIGPYTAAAISAFAFDKSAIVLDGNVERVMARYSGSFTPLPALKTELRDCYPTLAPDERHSDFAQAIMDLGARICIPAMPRCGQCPLQQICKMADNPDAAMIPVKPKKQPKPKREGIIFLATNEGQAVMERRPEKGLLGGMMGFPTAGWQTAKTPPASLDDAPFDADWRLLNHTVRHVFTHFELNLKIYHTELADKSALPAAYHLTSPDEAGLASVFAKVWQAATRQD